MRKEAQSDVHSLTTAPSLLITHHSHAYRSPGVYAKATASAHGQSPVCRQAGYGDGTQAGCFLLFPLPT